MPQLDDHDLERLLAKLSPPEPSDNLSQRIMDALPPRKPSWRQQVSDFFGGQNLLLPASSAFACLMFGLMLGYSPLTNTASETLEISESEILLAEVFGTDVWDTTLEEFTQ